MKKLACAFLMAVSLIASALGEGTLRLRYAHVNTADSIAGQMAASFAARVGASTGGSVQVEVYPDSRLGSIKEMTDMTSSGVVAFDHTTPSALGSFFKDFSVLDTPYIFSGLDHMLRVAALDSPIMAKLSEGLLRSSGLRVIGTFYFGARQLTCDRKVLTPSDLSGVKVRSIPFPVFSAAVEGLGAVPVPIDWAKTPMALASKVVEGQENPVNIVLSSRLYESQSHIMLTGHQLTMGILVMNDKAWRNLSPAQRAAVSKAASEACSEASRTMISQEARDLDALRSKGMIVVGPAEGLDLAAFRERTLVIVKERFSLAWKSYYDLIEKMR